MKDTAFILILHYKTLYNLRISNFLATFIFPGKLLIKSVRFVKHNLGWRWILKVLLLSLSLRSFHLVLLNHDWLFIIPNAINVKNIKHLSNQLGIVVRANFSNHCLLLNLFHLILMVLNLTDYTIRYYCSLQVYG